MGRPKIEKPSTSAERMKKWREKGGNRSDENGRRKYQRKLKTESMTDEARERLREENRVRKARSRLNQTRQKKVGLKLKDRNRKQNLSTVNEDSNSTERVKKHRSALKVCLIFKKNKIIHAKKSIKKTLSKLSPHSKVRAIAETCSETLTPKSKFSVAEQVDSVTEDIYQSIANKRDNVSNSAR